MTEALERKLRGYSAAQVARERAACIAAIRMHEPHLPAMRAAIIVRANRRMLADLAAIHGAA